MVMGNLAMLTACNSSETLQKTGPTITIGPSITATPTPTYEFTYIEQEMEELIDKAYEHMKSLPTTYEFDVSKDYKSEKDDYSGAGADVKVYDEKDNLTQLRMYDEKAHLYKAFVNYYEEGSEPVYGVRYDENVLTSYFETAEYNGKIRIEINIGDDDVPIASYVGQNAQVVEVRINK